MAGVVESRGFRFGPFELDRETGELRKHGIRVRLQGKPLQVLLALLERPGQVVTRDELKRRLWTEDTFVDFESGLNTAANRLRITLGDSADQPRYVETLARAGYRFIAPVGLLEVESAPVAVPPVQPRRDLTVDRRNAGCTRRCAARHHLLAEGRDTTLVSADHIPPRTHLLARDLLQTRRPSSIAPDGKPTRGVSFYPAGSVPKHASSGMTRPFSARFPEPESWPCSAVMDRLTILGVICFECRSTEARR